MIEQLKTINNKLAPIAEGDWNNQFYVIERVKQVLEIITQLEAMAGKQEPVAWVECDGELVWNNREAAIGRNLYTAAAPVAQQYEAGDVASAFAQGFRDGVASVAQQQQSEPFGYVSQHTNGLWEFSPTAAGVYPDTAKSITAVYTKQPQAEAVPPTHVLVPVEPDEMWAYQVIRHHQPDLEVGGTAWLECLKEMLHWHAAIAQQKGQP